MSLRLYWRVCLSLSLYYRRLQIRNKPLFKMLRLHFPIEIRCSICNDDSHIWTSMFLCRNVLCYIFPIEPTLVLFYTLLELICGSPGRDLMKKTNPIQRDWGLLFLILNQSCHLWLIQVIVCIMSLRKFINLNRFNLAWLTCIILS